jgi:hypothetical protein
MLRRTFLKSTLGAALLAVAPFWGGRLEQPRVAAPSSPPAGARYWRVDTVARGPGPRGPVVKVQLMGSNGDGTWRELRDPVHLSPYDVLAPRCQLGLPVTYDLEPGDLVSLDLQHRLRRMVITAGVRS